MEIDHIYRGRLIDHVQLVVRDLDASRRFYAAVLGALGMETVDGGGGFFWTDELVVSSASSEAAQGQLTGRTHLAFQAADEAMVEAAYRAGLADGGRDNGAPGLRAHYHPSYHAAFLLDPDGNNIEIVYHGPGRRSADSIRIDFGD